MGNKMRFFAHSVFVSGALMLSVLASNAEAPMEFYKEKQVRFLVSTSAGGGFDAFARLIARHIQRHTPGNPTFVVQNMPGAGGVKAANYLYSVAPKDGTVIGLFQNTVPFEPLYGNKQATFDATKFAWLGSPSQEYGVFVVWHTVPVNTIEDAKMHELIIGATGSNSEPAFFARVFESVFDVKIKILKGYPGTLETYLGTERGENDGNTAAYWSSLKATRPEWITEKKVKLLLQYGAHPDAEIKGVPFALDLVKDPVKHELLRVATTPLALGRPIAAPPSVPNDRAAALRRALAETFKDPEYLVECRSMHLECDDPVSAGVITASLSSAYNTSPEVIRQLRQIYQVNDTK
jgi:hypothetical protein